MLWIFLGIICLCGMIALIASRSKHVADVKKQVKMAIEDGRLEENNKDRAIDENPWPIPGFVTKTLGTVGIVFMLIGSWNGIFFMAEERYSYFVRDVAGNTHVYNTTGWHWKGFGNITPIKNEMSVQFSDKFDDEIDANGSGDGNRVSVMMSPRNITFLDQVTADTSTTVRFRMPNDKESILKIIDSFGNPANLMRSLLIPSTERTVDATSALMTADKYFSGGKTEFMNEFDRQMRSGLYVVRVEEHLEKPKMQRKGSANASKGTKQSQYGEDRKIVYSVVKQKDENDVFKRTPQEFSKYGITVVAALVTKLDPNPEFKDRMKRKQLASADLAIAREDRKKEEEKERLAVAKGKREIAESQAAELRIQVVATTKAETEKQLAITAANKELESAKIQEETAAIIYKRDKITAKSIKVLADAEAHKKKVIIMANGALEQKIEAFKYAVDANANAFAKYKAPQTVTMLGGSGSGSNAALSGSPDAMTQLLQLTTARFAKDLSLNMEMTGNTKKTR